MTSSSNVTLNVSVESVVDAADGSCLLMVSILGCIVSAVFGAVGVADTSDEYALVPTELSAATLKSYNESFVSPVTVAVVVMLVPSLNVFHNEDRKSVV